jgi:hypothetical protein
MSRAALLTKVAWRHLPLPSPHPAIGTRVPFGARSGLTLRQYGRGKSINSKSADREVRRMTAGDSLASLGLDVGALSLRFWIVG